jgi:transposase
MIGPAALPPSYPTAPHKNTRCFIAFLEYLLVKYPHQKLILVMDNASYHQSAAAQAASSLDADQIFVLWQPTYSPFVNPIEHFGCISSPSLTPIGCIAL